MKKSALAIFYIFFLFMYFMGFELMNNLKYGIPLRWNQYFGPFDLTNIIISLLIIFLAHYVVLRRYYYKRPRIRLCLYLFLLVALFIVLRYTIEELLFPTTLGIRNYNPKTTLGYYIIDNIYYGCIVLFIGFMFFLLDEQLRSQAQKAELLRQNKEAELKFLRSQMNPHFLYNSLNNIYALSYSGNPAATGAILKLSDMMRYITYEKQALVPLQKELKYVNDLVELQQLRLDHTLLLQVSCTTETESFLLPPFILIPLVENALKHGDFTNNQPLSIDISLTNGQLIITVSNRKSHAEKDSAGGVGLENIQKRLALLYQPGSYQFEINDAGNTFTVQLVLPPNMQA